MNPSEAHIKYLLDSNKPIFHVQRDMTHQLQKSTASSDESKFNHKNAPQKFLKIVVHQYTLKKLSFDYHSESEKVLIYQEFVILCFILVRHSCQVKAHKKDKHDGNYGSRKEPLGCLSYMFNAHHVNDHLKLRAAQVFETVLANQEVESHNEKFPCIKFRIASEILKSLKLEGKIGNITKAQLGISENSLDEVIAYVQEGRLMLQSDMKHDEKIHIQEKNKSFFVKISEIGHYIRNHASDVKEIYCKGKKEAKSLLTPSQQFTLLEKQFIKIEKSKTEAVSTYCEQPLLTNSLLQSRVASSTQNTPPLNSTNSELSESSESYESSSKHMKTIQNSTQPNVYDNSDIVRQPEFVKPDAMLLELFNDSTRFSTNFLGVDDFRLTQHLVLNETLFGTNRDTIIEKSAEGNAVVDVNNIENVASTDKDEYQNIYETKRPQYDCRSETDSVAIDPLDLNLSENDFNVIANDNEYYCRSNFPQFRENMVEN
jgi:hypothetical protein